MDLPRRQSTLSKLPADMTRDELIKAAIHFGYDEAEMDELSEDELFTIVDDEDQSRLEE